MTRRVLIVSPHFPPVNAPDHQRVRMSLPYFRENGWEAHVLAVDPRYVECARDPDLMQTIPEDIPVTRVKAVPQRFSRWVGLGNLGIRAYHTLQQQGDRLLSEGGFDLVYFSTTVFPVMSLGPRWKRRFGVPYVLDLQDPWLSDYYDRNGVRPPGGWWKYRVSQWLGRRSEPAIVRGAAHIVSVSPAYPEEHLRRYPGLGLERFTVLPFGAPEADLELVRRQRMGHTIFDAADGRRHWVYLGVSGPIMARGLRALFLALRSLRETQPEVMRLRLHFVGTSYHASSGAERTVEPLARECGVADLVSEQTERIPYLQGLALLQASDAVLVVGSDDPSYSPSKVFPCILAKRPLLAIMHEANLAGEVIRRCRAGSVMSFATGENSADIARRLEPLINFLLGNSRTECPATDWDAFRPHTAREMTRRQCEVFDTAIERATQVFFKITT